MSFQYSRHFPMSRWCLQTSDGSNPLLDQEEVLAVYRFPSRCLGKTHWHYEGKHFEAKAVSRGEFEALKRFGDYEELRDGTLMRMEGEKEFRIYCEDVEGFPFGLVTRGFCSMLSEAYDQMHAGAANGASGHGSQHETEEDA